MAGRSRSGGAGRRGGGHRYPRSARVGQTLREIIADDLVRIGDERLEFVTITQIEVDDVLQGELGLAKQKVHPGGGGLDYYYNLFLVAMDPTVAGATGQITLEVYDEHDHREDGDQEWKDRMLLHEEERLTATQP